MIVERAKNMSSSDDNYLFALRDSDFTKGNLFEPPEFVVYLDDKMLDVADFQMSFDHGKNGRFYVVRIKTKKE